MSDEALDAILKRRFASDPDSTPGVQVVVVSSSGIEYRGSIGLADPIRKAEEWVTTNHRANIYSVTKFFTACCVLRLIEEGKLTAETRARDVLPVSIGKLVNNCTVMQLATHTAGMPNPLPLGWVHGPDEEIDEEECLQRVLKENLSQQDLPAGGAAYRYSNVGYWILGCIIAHVCDYPMSDFPKICDELLFQNHLPEEKRKAISADFSGGPPVQAGFVKKWSLLSFATRLFVPKWLMGNTHHSLIRMEPHHLDGVSFGGLVSSSAAVSSFLQLILQGKVLLPKSMDLLMKDQGNSMTFGLHVRYHQGVQVYHKEGGGAGCRSAIHMRPQQDLAACVIAGNAEFNVHGLLDDILDYVEDINKTIISSQVLNVTTADGSTLFARCYRRTFSKDHEQTKPMLSEPVLLLHGGPGVPDYLEPLAQLLLGSNVASSVICFDQRGTGNSRPALEKTDLSMELVISDIACVSHAFSCPNIHLMGHSWGGILAQLYAIEFPQVVKSLVILNPTTASRASEWNQMEIGAMRYNFHKCGWLGFTKMGVMSALMMVPGFSDFAARSLLSRCFQNYYFDPSTAPCPPQSFLSGVSAKACFAYKEAFLRDVKDQMKVPTGDVGSIAIFGEHDIYDKDQVREFSNRIPVETIQNAGHLLWVDQPKKLINTLQKFYIKKLTGSRK